MKTVLIVEDEKIIRQGIRTMVQRSGVPVEIIMECSNGEMALDILREQEVDVMFTDIRMPKMDGIQLVKEIQKLDRKPEVVAISGYDDFSYAVEMLRNGVREYILKPVEREKIVEIMAKLEEELSAHKQKNQTEKKLGLAQIKHLLAEEEIKEEELAILVEKYEDIFFPGEYVVCVAGKDFEMEMRHDIFYVDDLPNCNLCILSQELLEVLLKNELWNQYAGISGTHLGVAEFRQAYQEALEARKRAFYQMKPVVCFDDPLPKVPEGLLTQARRHVEETAWTQRLHLVGTERTEELGAHWNTLFTELKKCHIDFKEFEDGMLTFLQDFHNLYRSMMTEEKSQRLEALSNIYGFLHSEAYEDALMNLVLEVHSEVNQKEDNSKNQQKIKQAIAYIDEHYNEDLNMAVVSNEISMNYSLFSFAFKQYTGTNFVTYLRDIRIEKAKKLLAETDLKVIDISQQVGYDNEKHFMKVFKSVCGVSPTEFRKNMSQS